jgi:hypothetical protein
MPNCTQVVIGETTSGSPDDIEGQTLVLLEANVDDATGETLAHAVANFLDAGAYDAWLSPVLMKKGRPGHVVSVLADPSVADDFRKLIRAETGSLGVRSVNTERWASARDIDEVEVDGMTIRMKVSPGRVKAEHRDAALVASRTGLPLRVVVSRAEAAWWGRTGAQPPIDDRPTSA